MPCTDFIGDFLTVIRNGSRAHKDKVTIPSSNFTARLGEILKSEGFVDSVKVFSEGNKKFIRIHLKYLQGSKKPALRGIKRISKPGIRTYVASSEVPRVQGGLGIAIVSTSKGIITDREARQQNVGGELICKVW